MQANLNWFLPHFYQHVTCATRGKDILDHLYSTHRDAYSIQSSPSPSICLPIPAYKRKLKKEVPVTRSIQKWSDDADATLQDCFACTDWNMFRDSSNGIEEYSTSIIGFINKCIDRVICTVTVRTYPNQKPWITGNIRFKPKARTAAFMWQGLKTITDKGKPRHAREHQLFWVTV